MQKQKKRYQKKQEEQLDNQVAPGYSDSEVEGGTDFQYM